MAFSKEFKVGILVTIIIFIIYVGANFLKGKDIFSTSNIYYTTYQNVKGLNKGNPITLNGLSVGRIQNIDILPKEPHKIQVTLAVDKKIKLTNNTVARIESSLLGNKNIELILKEGDNLQQYSYLQGDIEQDFTAKFVEISSPALNDIKKITVLMSQFMQNMVENADRINATFAHLEHTAEQLDKAITANQEHFTKMSKNMADVVDTLADKDIGIEPLLSNTNLLLLEATNILTLISKGPLYQNIDQTFVELNKLLIDLQNHPNKYVHFSIFGNKASRPKSSKKLSNIGPSIMSLPSQE